ncbi:MAG: type II secretion system protein [Verrucomicrobiota bacterium]|jgi:type II secretory pathway pseudopilin PulG
MVHHLDKAAGRKSRVACAAFTLIEVMIGFFIFGLVTAGMIYGYVEANRMAEWSSQSLAAMSYASQGMEQMRSAQWNAEEYSTGSWQTDVLLPYMKTQPDGTFGYWTNQTDYLDIPTSGALISVTNYLYVTPVSTNPPLRRIVSQVVWSFRLTGQLFTNTMVTLRAPDQLQ